MDVKFGPCRRLSTEKLMLLKCGVGEDSWESLDCKIKSVNPKGNQSWIFIRSTDAKTEAPILWPPDSNSQLFRKDLDARKYRRQEGTTENEMVQWHYWLEEHEFEQALGHGEGQGSLACCSLWGLNETWLSNWTTTTAKYITGFPGGTSDKEPSCQYKKRQQMWVWSLGQEDPLEEYMTTYFSTTAWRIPWTEEPGGLQCIGLQRVRHDWNDLACMHSKYIINYFGD